MIDAEKINRLSSSNWDPIDLRPQKIQSQRTPDEYLSLPGYIGGIRVACDRAEAERLAASRNDEINSTVGAKTCLDGTEYTVLASKAGGSRDAISISISEPKNLWGDTFFIAPGEQDEATEVFHFESTDGPLDHSSPAREALLGFFDNVVKDLLAV